MTYIMMGHNGFYSITNNLGGGNNVTNTSLLYARGPLGNWYIYSVSPTLIDKGSRGANSAGLYHYTMFTNLLAGWEIKETNSVVDLGFHYVATDNIGNPIDADGDGIADYLEDSNGDGTFNTGDLSDWSTYNSVGGLSGANGLQVFTPLK
jgi:hypothetical protein